MYLTVNSLIDKNNIITGFNNIALRKVNIKAHGYDKIYIDKDLMEDTLHQSIDQFNERNVNHRYFYFALLSNIHPFFGWRTFFFSRYCRQFQLRFTILTRQKV